MAALDLVDAHEPNLQTAGPLLLGRPAAESWPLARVLELLSGRGRGFVDFGAGDGAASVTLADGFSHGLAIEPDAAKRRALQRNLVLNALDNMQVQAQIDTIDAARLLSIDLLRIDAAPHLAPVLQGASATIARDRPLLLRRLSGSVASDAPSLAALDAHAYDGQRLRPITRCGVWPCHAKGAPPGPGSTERPQAGLGRPSPRRSSKMAEPHLLETTHDSTWRAPAIASGQASSPHTL